MYSGRYKNPQTLAARVNEVENPLQALKENVFVAVHIQDYNKPPVLGKVTAVHEEDSSFDLEYWKGTWKTEWKPWKLSNGEVWTDNLPNSCVLLVDFQFDKNNKLSHETYKYLKDKYNEL